MNNRLIVDYLTFNQENPFEFATLLLRNYLKFEELFQLPFGIGCVLVAHNLSVFLLMSLVKKSTDIV